MSLKHHDRDALKASKHHDKDAPKASKHHDKGTPKAPKPIATSTTSSTTSLTTSSAYVKKSNTPGAAKPAVGASSTSNVGTIQKPAKSSAGPSKTSSNPPGPSTGSASTGTGGPSSTGYPPLAWDVTGFTLYKVAPGRDTVELLPTSQEFRLVSYQLLTIHMQHTCHQDCGINTSPRLVFQSSVCKN